MQNNRGLYIKIAFRENSQKYQKISGNAPSPRPVCFMCIPHIKMLGAHTTRHSPQKL